MDRKQTLYDPSFSSPAPVAGGGGGGRTPAQGGRAQGTGEGEPPAHSPKEETPPLPSFPSWPLPPFPALCSPVSPVILPLKGKEGTTFQTCVPSPPGPLLSVRQHPRWAPEVLGASQSSDGEFRLHNWANLEGAAGGRGVPGAQQRPGRPECQGPSAGCSSLLYFMVLVTPQNTGCPNITHCGWTHTNQHSFWYLNTCPHSQQHDSQEPRVQTVHMPVSLRADTHSVRHTLPRGRAPSPRCSGREPDTGGYMGCDSTCVTLPGQACPRTGRGLVGAGGWVLMADGVGASFGVMECSRIR
ncbi:unnamed protein product [Nyctereutes procyonoides]|uniref:(raccoon dog) hypothetical protein n=1 Tax=Nyctereutes procyonoides TaxID=34880 RepID=A0A811ZAP2_NYCPR|nr:unnamed protein product [Nyctereutes procyonoides]